MAKVLIVGDAGQPTGFERVTRAIGNALHLAGMQVVHAGIGYNKRKLNVPTYSYPVVEVGSTQTDPLGVKSIPRLLKAHKPDLTLFVQDLWHQNNYLGYIPKGHKTLGYYPVDTPNMKSTYALAAAVLTEAVPYTQFGAKETAIGIRRALDLIAQGNDRSTVIQNLIIEKHGMKLHISMEGLADRQNLSGYRPIPHGISPEKFWPETKAKAREYFGLSKDMKLLLYVSTNQFRKRQDIAMRTLYHLRKQDPSVYLAFHAVDYDYDGWDLLDLARLYKVENYVIPVHEKLPRLTDEQLRLLYSAADMHINTSGGEGWGLCVGPTTLIPTARGFKQIVAVMPGDLVVNEAGTWSRVYATTHRSVSTYFQVDVVGHETLQVTPEHPFLSVRGNMFNTPALAATAKWTKAGELQPGDFVAVGQAPTGTLPTVDLAACVDSTWEKDETALWHPMGYSSSTNAYGIRDLMRDEGITKKVAEKAMSVYKKKRTLGSSPSVAKAVAYLETTSPTLYSVATYRRYITLDAELCWALGWYLAEGSGDSASCEFAMHEDEWAIAEKLGTVITSRIGGTALVSRASSAHGIKLSINGAPVAKFFEWACGKLAPNKRVNSQIPLGNSLLKHLWRGYVEGDGHRTKTGSCSITSTSRELLAQLQLSLATFGYKVSVAGPSSPGTIGNYEQYTASLSVEATAWLFDESVPEDYRPNHRMVVAEGHCWVRVRSIEKVDAPLEVYDLAVEGTHSFVGNGVIVHNTSVEAGLCGVPQAVPDWSATRELWAGAGVLLPVSDYRFEPKFSNTAHALVDPKASASILADILNNTQEMKKLSEDALVRARQWPTWAEVGKEFVGRVRDVLDRSPARPMSLNDVLAAREGVLTSDLFDLAPEDATY